MDAVQKGFAKFNWPYATRDPHACRELESRITKTGRARSLINYSDLVRGVSFELDNLSESPRVIDVNDWQDLDRAIVGDFLGYISLGSYQRGRFFASALVVGKSTHSPGEGFFNLLSALEMIADVPSKDMLEAIWLEHVSTAYDWLAKHRL